MCSATRLPVLVLSPHPDDESLGCGGTIKLLTEAGTAVDVLYMTHGELGADVPEAATPQSRERLAGVRTQEALAACHCLGVRDVAFLTGKDGCLEQQNHLADELLTKLKADSYARVFCPWPQEKHPDHQATYLWLRAALARYPTALNVWLYEVWTPLPPSICVPIDATMEAKRAAIRAHQSQLACLDYLSAFEGLAAYRGLLCAGCRYAEAFITTDRHAMLDSQ